MTPSVTPILLTGKMNKAGRCPIVIRVYLAGKHIHQISIGKRITPAQWNEDKRQVRNNHPQALLINQLISRQVRELEDKFMKMSLQDVPMTTNRVKSVAKGLDPGKDFYKWLDEYVPIHYQGASPRTLETVGFEISKLKRWRPDLSFNDLDYKFLTEYKAYLIRLGNSDNTIWKAMKFLNTMINAAVKVGGYIQRSPFNDFNRGTYKQVERPYLTLQECDNIKALLPALPKELQAVGYYYLFMCYTGLRYTDATTHFNYDTHVINEERIVMQTEKADTVVNLLLHDRLRDVLAFIKHHHLKMPNKTFNIHLKIIGSMANIRTPLSAHVGRHTFGATLADLDVPIEVAQKLLGHRDRKSTEIYYHLKNTKMDEAMKRFDK